METNCSGKVLLCLIFKPKRFLLCALMVPGRVGTLSALPNVLVVTRQMDCEASAVKEREGRCMSLSEASAGTE